jgi:hypothetical protein
MKPLAWAQLQQMLASANRHCFDITCLLKETLPLNVRQLRY